MFHNNMGASPDGPVYADPDGASSMGIVELKCLYSLRDREIGCDSDWHHRLHYLDCQNELNTEDYYHQIQGAIARVGGNGAILSC